MKDLRVLSTGMNIYQKYKTKNLGNDNITRFHLDASFQGVNRLFVLAFNSTNNAAKKVERDIHRKYFLPKVDK